MRLRPPLLTLAALLALAPALPAQRLRVPVPVEQLEAAARTDSNDAIAHYNLGLGYWSKARYDDAERSFHTAVTLDPRFAPAHLALAYLPFARRDKLWDEVLTGRVPDAQRAAVDESDRAYRRAMLADPMVDLRVMGAIEPGRNVAFDLNDDLAKFYEVVFRGFDDFRDAKYADAYARFDRLAREVGWDRHPEQAPTDFLFFRGLAEAHTARNAEAVSDVQMIYDRYLSAEKAHRDSITYLPLQTNEYRYLLAYLEQRNGQGPEALTLYQQVATEDAGHYMAHVRMAEIYEGLGQWPDAIQERERAAQTSPDDASLLLDWGVTLGKAGRFADAESRFQDAIQLQPRDTRAYYWLGIAELQLGKGPEARTSFEKFVALAPSRYAAQITSARQHLAQLP